MSSIRKKIVFPDQSVTTLRISDEVWGRHNSTCFGTLAGRPFAGKFIFWRTLTQIFDDAAFLLAFNAVASRIFGALGANGTHNDRLVLRLGLKTGWEPTAPRQDFVPSDLESFRPYPQTRAYRVRRSANRLAPLTNAIALNCRFLAGDSGRAIDLFEICPSATASSLAPRPGSNQDLTAATGRVYFPYDYPGEPLNS